MARKPVFLGSSPFSHGPVWCVCVVCLLSEMSDMKKEEQCSAEGFTKEEGREEGREGEDANARGNHSVTVRDEEEYAKNVERPSDSIRAALFVFAVSGKE